MAGDDEAEAFHTADSGRGRVNAVNHCPKVQHCTPAHYD